MSKLFFIAFLNPFFKIEIKKQQHCRIFRGAGTDEHLNWDWLCTFLLLQLTGSSYIFFLILIQTRKWVYGSSYIFSFKISFVCQISLHIFYRWLNQEFQFKDCQLISIPRFNFPVLCMRQLFILTWIQFLHGSQIIV